MCLNRDRSVLKQILKLENYQLLKYYLNAMIASDRTGFLYSEAIDHQLKKISKTRFNLIPFCESQIAYLTFDMMTDLRIDLDGTVIKSCS